jgi:hypothetical protein
VEVNNPPSEYRASSDDADTARVSVVVAAEPSWAKLTSANTDATMTTETMTRTLASPGMPRDIQRCNFVMIFLPGGSSSTRLESAATL